MKLSLPRIKKFLPDINVRPLGEADFWQVCASRKIEVFERRFRKKGYYIPDASGEFILIDSRLKSYFWLEVAFHELTHALLHYPSPFLASKQQFEASAFAIMALCPLSELKGGEMRYYAKYDHRLRFIIRERERLNFLYGV